MNDSQNTAGSTSSQYGPTQNPQTPGGQNLSNPATDLQTSTPSLFTGDNSASITSIGDSTFSPYSSENSTSTSVTSAPKAVNHHYPIIVGSALLVIVVLIASWLIVRKQPSY